MIKGEKKLAKNTWETYCTKKKIINDYVFCEFVKDRCIEANR